MARMKKSAQSKTGAEAVVRLKKMADASELPPQALAILAILKAKGGAQGAEELVKAMQSKVESVQPMARIWGFYKARLVRKGFISIAVKKEAK